MIWDSVVSKQHTLVGKLLKTSSLENGFGLLDV